MFGGHGAHVITDEQSVERVGIQMGVDRHFSYTVYQDKAEGEKRKKQGAVLQKRRKRKVKRYKKFINAIITHKWVKC